MKCWLSLNGVFVFVVHQGGGVDGGHGGGILSSSTSWGSSGILSFSRKLKSVPRRSSVSRDKQRLLGFGDYSEVPESCPAMTTCPLICVSNETDCPTTCSNPEEILCPDGSCAATCDENATSPCACGTLAVACPSIDLYFSDCQANYSDYYSAEASCVEAQQESLDQVDWYGPWFIVCYVGISAVSLLVFLWCFFNQKLAPVRDSTLPITPADNDEEDGATTWTQTGYKVHFIGYAIYMLVWLVFISIQVVLFVLVIFYYQQQGAIFPPPVFSDQAQVLAVFEIAWICGFAFSLTFQYPSIGMKSLFMRRCRLTEANYVAVVSDKKVVKVISTTNPLFDIGGMVFKTVFLPLDLVMRFVFSYPYGRPGEDVAFCPVTVHKLTGTRSIYHRMRRYVLIQEQGGKFIPGVMTVGNTVGELLSKSSGLSTDQAQELLGFVGPNIVPMPKPTLISSIATEFSKTFYVYQNFMVWTWAPYWYYYMAIVQTFVRVSGGLIVAVIHFMGRNQLYKISYVEGQVLALRDGEFALIDIKDIVPGDVLRLMPGYVHCDMAVVRGDNILLDESALTGEAMAKPKKPLDPTAKDAVFDPIKRHAIHQISAGTTILDVGENEALGLVTKTGSFTAKGELLSDVLSYKRHKFKFDDEVKFVIFILFIEGIIGFCLACYFLKNQLVYAFFYGIFIVGTCVPPLLPTVFVVSVGISANRLQKNRITCTYQEGILVAGKVKNAFFDKTGTLTKEHMDFIGSDSATHEEQLKVGMAVCNTLRTSKDVLVGPLLEKTLFEAVGASMVSDEGGMTTITVGESKYVVLKSFEFDSHRATQSVVVRDENGKGCIFVKGSPEAMQALCQTVPDSFNETIRKASKSGLYQLVIGFKELDEDVATVLSLPREDIESSLTYAGFINFRNFMRENTPAVIDELIEGDVACTVLSGDSVFTALYIAREAGIVPKDRRVLVGTRLLDNGTIEWIDAETDGVVNGSALGGDALTASMVEKPEPEAASMVEKPEPEAVPDDELDAERNNRIDISPYDLAVSGEVWRHMIETDPKASALIAKKIKVFGRCNPSDKVSVVATFIESGATTLMVGDGQNDCGALKMAHVGIALSSNEASIVAPFTSLDKDIGSCLEVLREGRCALASALACYKYYITYGQVETYLQLINAYFAITFTEWCWVCLDGLWSISMAFTLPLSKSAKRLSPFRPTASLLGRHTMGSILSILSWNFLFICIGLLALFSQDWFQCRKWSKDDVSSVIVIGDNYESNVLFSVGGYQYIASAMALNFGYVFREGYFRNYVFVFFSILWSVGIFVMVLYPSTYSCIWRVNCDNDHVVRLVTTSEPMAINNVYNTTVMPEDFRWKLFSILVANALTLCGWEYFVVNGPLLRKARAKRLAHAESQSGGQEIPVEQEILVEQPVVDKEAS